jgi:hypothetical protein
MMMSSPDETSDSETLRMDLLRKLENPLGFIGENTLSHVCFNGKWTRVKDIFEKASVSSHSKDRVLTSLRERMDEIKERMTKDSISKEEAFSLFEEGITVKKTLYSLRNDVFEDAKHSDTRRWLNYGRSIS